MYEHRSRPPLTRGAFFLRILCHFLVAVAFVGVSLGVGMIGYWHFEHDQPVKHDQPVEHDDMKTPRDAFLNAAMLLGGMGPVHNPRTECGKVFAGLYALYAGLVFLVAAALLLTPIFHRLLHRFHWDQSSQNARPRRSPPSDESGTT
jgi:protein-S-isoprenylcysteine O-methyltransferase Ste14